ncbi:MAG TPA: aldose epimerase family protein [Candidatus Sulfotelmatobacter sp.]|jgi:aldose 1-epimerase|nr:aldose epimerase family protein [Candidatus Sulfotelmatobacter sp.]
MLSVVRRRKKANPHREKKAMLSDKANRWLAIFAVLTMLTTTVSAKTRVSKQPFGQTPEGRPVDIYSLADGKIEVGIITYGGIVVSLRTPDRSGKLDDVVLGCDSVEKYVAQTAHFGGIIGRYANRIAHGTFQLDGQTYSIPKNDGDNALHGGIRGFDKVVWAAKQIADGIELTYVSKDGDQGFPGTLTTRVRYTLSGGALRIDYSATTDKDTVLNLTNHSYFNLAGQGKGDVLGHVLKIDASRITPVDATLIPTGELKGVEGTPFDFRTPHALGERIEADDAQLHLGHGYDHNFVLDHAAGQLAEAAEMYEPTTGRILRVSTTEPGVQLYTGNFLDGSITGKEGRVYKRRFAFCLETQHFADSPNHPNFPSTELKPGQIFHSVTVLEFSAGSR